MNSIFGKMFSIHNPPKDLIHKSMSAKHMNYDKDNNILNILVNNTLSDNIINYIKNQLRVLHVSTLEEILTMWPGNPIWVVEYDPVKHSGDFIYCITEACGSSAIWLKDYKQLKSLIENNGGNSVDLYCAPVCLDDRDFLIGRGIKDRIKQYNFSFLPDKTGILCANEFIMNPDDNITPAGVMGFPPNYIFLTWYYYD